MFMQACTVKTIIWNFPRNLKKKVTYDRESLNAIAKKVKILKPSIYHCVPCALFCVCLGSSWATDRWRLLLEVAFIKRHLSWLILFTIFQRTLWYWSAYNMRHLRFVWLISTLPGHKVCIFSCIYIIITYTELLTYKTCNDGTALVPKRTYVCYNMCMFHNFPLCFSHQVLIINVSINNVDERFDDFTCFATETYLLSFYCQFISAVLWSPKGKKRFLLVMPIRNIH
jgi:hypothetical protein